MDKDKKEKEISNNLFLIEKYALEYVGSMPLEKVTLLARNKYYMLAEEYYNKNIKNSFDGYIKKGLRSLIKNIDVNYVDENMRDDFTKK